jgi:FtsH-binding integral membrane protein
MSVRNEGRVAGVIYLGVVLTGIFTLAFAPGRLIVDGDPAATAAAMAENIDLFRDANVAALAMCGFFLALPFALARFLSPYGKTAARLMILFVAASIPFSLLAIAQHYALEGLVADGVATAAETASRLAAYDKWMDMASIFWGLWLAPLGFLILKSGAIPRFLGVLLFFGFLGYLANYFGPLVHDGFTDLPFRGYVSKAGSIGEIGTCLWLCVMGARGARPA